MVLADGVSIQLLLSWCMHLSVYIYTHKYVSVDMMAVQYLNYTRVDDSVSSIQSVCKTTEQAVVYYLPPLRQCFVL